MRVAIFVIFAWTGVLKFWQYEASGIVPFVANSPFMSFFYAKGAPEYASCKIPEGVDDEKKTEWHRENRTYEFSRGLGILIISIGTFAMLGGASPRRRSRAIRSRLYEPWTLLFLAATPEVWVPILGSPEHRFPLLSGAGRLVIKYTAISLNAAILLTLPESSRKRPAGRTLKAGLQPFEVITRLAEQDVRALS